MKLDWERLEPTTVQKVGNYRTLVTKTFRLPDGSVHEYVTKEKEDSHSIATIAVTPQKQIVVARQFRPGPQKVLDELPGGGANPNEDFADAACRELQEETGYQVGQIQHIGDIYKDAYTNTKWHYFLATDCTPHPDGPKPDDREFIDVKLISIDELFDNARNAAMTDTECVFLAYDKLLALQV